MLRLLNVKNMEYQKCHVCTLVFLRTWPKELSNFDCTHMVPYFSKTRRLPCAFVYISHSLKNKKKASTFNQNFSNKEWHEKFAHTHFYLCLSEGLQRLSSYLFKLVLIPPLSHISLGCCMFSGMCAYGYIWKVGPVVLTFCFPKYNIVDYWRGKYYLCSAQELIHKVVLHCCQDRKKKDVCFTFTMF